MNNSELRQPVQKRAIEKKEKILECGFKLMCEKGYHNTDAIEIANSAGVSTGTVYQYFVDKRDIFLQGLKKYSKTIMFPIINLKDKKIKKEDLYNEFKAIIEKNIKEHKFSKIAHEEITAMQHTDSEVSKIFHEFEIEATEVFVQFLKDNNIVVDNIYEKAHLAICWIDNLCHEIIYHEHEYMDYVKMTDIVINSLINLLK